ncbi:MAG: PAS domain S-box protein, partial [Spirochaetaceae bacterium]|nr:PAS domain S-box protein [Spirochaetaceae bacterium]
MKDDNRTKAELIAELQSLRGVIDHCSEGIALTDEDGIIIEWNKRLAVMTGVPAAEALGRPIWEVQYRSTPKKAQTQELRSRLEDTIRGYLRTGEIPEGHTKSVQVLQHPDGSERYQMHSLFSIKTNKGYMLSSVTRDVTEQHLTVRALEKSEQLFRLAFRTSPDPFIISRMDDGRIVDANDAFCEMTGYSREEIIGAVSNGLNIWVSLADRTRLIGKLTDCGEVRGMEFSFRMKDGSSRTGLISARAFDFRGVPHVLSVIKNVEELEGAERALRAHSRYQATLSEIGRMALTTSSRQELLDEAVTRVAASLDVKLCKVLELQPDGDEVLVVAGIGWRDGCVGSATVEAKGASQAGYTLLTRDPVVVADLATDTRFSGPDLLNDHGVVSGVSTIIGDPDNPFGILAVHTKDRREFSYDEINFVQSVANILAEATHRLRTDARLQESEALFRTMYESSSVGIARVSLDHQIEEINQAYCTMLGYTRDELVGMTIWDITDPECLPESERLQTRLRQGEIDSYQMAKKYLRKDGGAVWGLLDASLVRDTNGDPFYFLGNVVDVTERKRTESENRNLSIGVEQSPVAIVVTDPGGAIEYVNTKFCAISGYTKEEALGQNPRILKSGEQPAEIYEDLWATITSGRTWSGQFHNKRKNGELYWEDATIGPIVSEQGEITHFIGFKEDITEKKDL